MSTIVANHTFSVPLGADHLIFEGGLEDFENKFPAIQGERKKNHAAYNREKKISCKREGSKKNSYM
jgi:hypothetical protein